MKNEPKSFRVSRKEFDSVRSNILRSNPAGLVVSTALRLRYLRSREPLVGQCPFVEQVPQRFPERLLLLSTAIEPIGKLIASSAQGALSKPCGMSRSTRPLDTLSPYSRTLPQASQSTAMRGSRLNLCC